MIIFQSCTLVWKPSLKFKSWTESSVGFFLTGNGENKKLGWWRSALIITESSYESSSDDIYWLPVFLQLFSPKKYQHIKSQVCGEFSDYFNWKLTSHKSKTFAFFLSINRTKVRQTANKCNRKSWKSCIINNYHNWWIRIHDPSPFVLQMLIHNTIDTHNRKGYSRNTPFVIVIIPPKAKLF